MKQQPTFRPKKYQKKNLNKFLNLKKLKNSSCNYNIISSNASVLKSETKKTIEFFLKKRYPLKGLNWLVGLNKNRTKKPMGSKLGGGKSKIDYYYSSLKKYKPIFILNSNKFFKFKMKEINKVLNLKLKQNVK